MDNNGIRLETLLSPKENVALHMDSLDKLARAVGLIYTSLRNASTCTCYSSGLITSRVPVVCARSRHGKPYPPTHCSPYVRCYRPIHQLLCLAARRRERHSVHP